MRRRILLIAATCLTIMTTGAAALTHRAVAAGYKENKLTYQVADIQGAFTGALGLDHPITVQLMRRNGNQLTAAATVQTKANGDFLFASVPPGEYVVTPELATVPAGMGLYQRHVFVVVHREPVRVTFTVGQVEKLVPNVTEVTLAAPDDSVYLETAAYDALGQHLFAASKFDIPADVQVLESNDNGVRLKSGPKLQKVNIHAQAGQRMATILLKR